MKKSTYLIVFITLLCHGWTFAQDDYRSVATGNWNNPAIWESFSGGVWGPASAAPSSADGVITIQNGHTVTITAAVTADQLVVASGGALSVNAGLTLNNGAGTDLDIAGGGTVNMAATSTLSGLVVNGGNLNWTGGTITFSGFTLNNIGSFNITGDNTAQGTGANAINNLAGGVITKSTGTGTTTIGSIGNVVNLSNEGTINVTTGTLTLQSMTVVNSGTLNIASGATLNVPGSAASVTFNTGSVVAGAGFLRINGGGANGTTVNFGLVLPSTLTYESGGQIDGTGTLTINGTMEWTVNAIRIPLTIAAGATFNSTGSGNRTISNAVVNNGTINWDAEGDLVFSFQTVNPSITNNGTFNWNATANQQIRVFSGGPQVFTNNGVFNKTVGTTTLSFPSILFTNSATGTINGVGIITFSGTGALTNNGTIAPGNSAGQLTINPTAVTSNSTIQIEILNNGGAGIGHDVLTLTGATDLAGSTLNIIDNNSAPAGTYTIMTTTAGNFLNTFGTVNKPSNFADPVVTADAVTIEKLYSLPVVWGEFTVKASGQQALLTWQTLQEQNTSHFVVERSKDGINFTAIGNIPAKGNSTFTSTYTFTDPTPELKVNNFYRLLQVDLDGKSEHSIIRSIKIQGGNDPYITVQGNPVKNNMLKVSVTADKAVQVTFSDMTGKMVKSVLLQPGVQSIPVSELQAGTYQLSVIQNGKLVDTKRIMKF